MEADLSQERLGESLTVEVRVYYHGQLLHVALCESAEEAAAAVARWGEIEGVECEVDDLSARHEQGQILEPSADDMTEEDYPRGAEAPAEW